MSRSTDELSRYLSDILSWGDRLSSHLIDVTEEMFRDDPEKIDAICWCFACIGEAAGKICQGWPEFAASHPEMELAKAYALRNRIAHGYQVVDTDLVWRAATVSLPTLVEAVRISVDATT